MNIILPLRKWKWPLRQARPSSRSKQLGAAKAALASSLASNLWAEKEAADVQNVLTSAKSPAQKYKLGVDSSDDRETLNLVGL